MKRSLFCSILLILTLTTALQAFAAAIPTDAPKPSALTLIGHASIKIITSTGTVLYIDPYYQGDYNDKADIILVSHEHQDHNKVSLCTPKEGCLTLRVKQTINSDGTYNAFSHKDVLIEPLPAYNKNHSRKTTNGFLITFDGITVYFASDTGKTPEMDSLANRPIDYAFFPIDGKYNMDAAEAMACAAAVKALHNVPMHWFNADPALFQPENLLFIPYGDTISLGGA
jgi:L-ascorbate metabolism protein UlaG (beta-lactamase superfamily)